MCRGILQPSSGAAIRHATQHEWPEAEEAPRSGKPAGILQWMLLQFLMIIPFVGIDVVLVMAFAGGNRTREDHFRARILWVALPPGLYFLPFPAVLSLPLGIDLAGEIVRWFNELWPAILDVVPKATWNPVRWSPRFGRDMKIEFRPCVAADREWAYALKCEAYREVVERQFGPWDEEKQRAMFGTRWRPDRSRIIVVDGDDAGLLATDDHTEFLWVDEIQIGREWRGRGVGTAVLNDLLDQARSAGKPLRLQVLRENHRAKELYLRLGFSRTGGSATHFLMERR